MKRFFLLLLVITSSILSCKKTVTYEPINKGEIVFEPSTITLGNDDTAYVVLKSQLSNNSTLSLLSKPERAYIYPYTGSIEAYSSINMMVFSYTVGNNLNYDGNIVLKTSAGIATLKINKQ